MMPFAVRFCCVLLLALVLGLQLPCRPARATPPPEPGAPTVQERLQAIDALIAAGKLDEARRQNRGVLFQSQLLRDEVLLFRSQWQSARILRRLERLDEALAMNRMAVQTLQRVRNSTGLAGSDCFRDTVRPAYIDLAGLLLVKASAASPGGEREQLLKEAITTVERLRSDEIKDYLRLPCLPVNDVNLLERQELLEHAAVIYLIDFDDQVGIIANHAGRFTHFTTSVPTRQVKAEALLMIDAIRTLDGNYREPALRLYRWLLAPLEPFLADAEPLIIVPDGATRAIPFPALVDGQGKFLVETHAVVMNQGLSITAAGSGPAFGNRRFFLGGISEAVAGHNAIPAVSSELQSINRLFPSEVLQDRQFTAGQIGSQMQEEIHPVVHLASHGQFTGESSQSFILTWDGRLNIQEIAEIARSGERQGEVIDLVTLSACSTAVGDDRAALGLAGVTLKAGARSAIASLWNVDDEATEKFFVNFYSLLQSDSRLSKAEALRRVQLKYLSGDIASTALRQADRSPRDFAHPFFWAPFVLTGNWL